MHGRHLTLAEREHLAIELALGKSKAQVARELGCDVTTVRRELRRNGANGTYLPARAQALAQQRRRDSKQPWKLSGPELAAFVQDGLRQYWSPQEIAGRWRKDHPRQKRQWVSHQCLYDWIWRRKDQGEAWHRYLRRAHKKRRKRQESPENRGRIAGRVGIERRPAIVETRRRLGDWESDRIEGGGSKASLASHVERKSRYTVLEKLQDGKAATFNAGTVRAFERHGKLPLRTLTADNGKEFAAHAELSAKLGLEVYFARPYHAWERGTNENTNGLVRQFFPKGLDLRQVTPRQVAAVEHLLNNRPRKCLGYRTPVEVLRRR
jgi:transposase, IS30 family